MTAWTWYEVRYQALSPLHLGYHKLGMVQRTRSYIPARVWWGALVNNLAQGLCEEGNNPLYQKVGEEILDILRMTCLFPCRQDSSIPLIPWFGAREDSEWGLGFGVDRTTNKPKPALSAAQFERQFLFVHGQTSIASAYQTAQDASLHETEFLAHRVHCRESGRLLKIYFTGYLGIKSESANQHGVIQTTLRDLAVGGDRSYGYGRLRLLTGFPRRMGKEDTFFGAQIDLSQAPRFISWPAGLPIPAHVLYDEELGIQGDLEPLVGRETDDQGFGQRLSKVRKCWAPGSVLKGDSPRNFVIEPDGVWHWQTQEE